MRRIWPFFTDAQRMSLSQGRIAWPRRSSKRSVKATRHGPWVRANSHSVIGLNGTASNNENVEHIFPPSPWSFDEFCVVTGTLSTKGCCWWAAEAVAELRRAGPELSGSQRVQNQGISRFANWYVSHWVSLYHRR